MNLDKTNQVHKTLIHVIFNVFVMVKEDIDQMALEMCLKTSTGEWLDLWGSYFGIPRLSPNEPDEIYSDRIIDKIISPKATVSAIKSSTAKWLYYTYGNKYEPSEIEVTEPWKNLLVTSYRGAISHYGRLPDASYWTAGVIDIAIPDASEMSSDLIIYLNTIKAAGVQIAWHTTMNWGVVTGYFDCDSVTNNFEMYFDLYIKRENEVANAFRTKSEWFDYDSEYQSAISVTGLLSGGSFNKFEVAEFRDFEPFRMTLHADLASPLIKMSDVFGFLGKSQETATIADISRLELTSDRQIPNIDDFYGKSLEDELKPYQLTDVDGIIEELSAETVDGMTDENCPTVNQLIIRFREDATMLKHIVNDWNKQKYLNRGLNTNPLSISTGPIQILTITDN